MMAFALAESGSLKADRGDIVLFANTSAEHPGTYAFSIRCKQRLEQDYGLPFFWYEFCTVEDGVRGQYARRQSYRLVKASPVESDPQGYRSRGEVFEELLSYQGMLPTPMSRSCTAKLKLYPQHLLLAEWLGGTEGPLHRGHHADRSFFEADTAAQLYRANGGSAKAEAYRERVGYMARQPTSRAAQRWRDYTAASLYTAWQPRRSRPAPLFGPKAVQFVTLLGLRADEPQRVQRIVSRSLLAEGAQRRKCSVRTQPPGERPYFPLQAAGVCASDVRDFWRSQDFDLRCPEHAGNCVYCFMKGTKQLSAAARAEDPQRVAGAPSDILWWADIERRYRREAPRRNGEGISRFGFLGVSGPSFDDISAGAVNPASRFSSDRVACDCTD